MYTRGFVLLSFLCWDDAARVKLRALLGDYDQELGPVVTEDPAQCTQKMNQFDRLEGQQLWDPSKGERDPLFPPVLSSIAAPGTFCGDTAQGAQSSCERYNNWRSIGQISTRRSQYSLWSSRGIQVSDIEQGALGNCYFLAALASITVNHPEIISNMFVDTHLWQNGLFRTKWLVNGKTRTITVDDVIPASRWGGPYFTRPARGDQWWPVILSKSWAKIFSSYKSIEGGNAGEVIKAMTRSPGVYEWMKQYTASECWEFLLDAFANKYPMGASTCGNPPEEGSTCGHPKKYGLATGHAYAVLDAYEHPQYGRVVKVFNPWNRNKYKGAVPSLEATNASRTGVFTMTLDEFHDAFQSITVAYVKAGYQATSVTMKANTLSAVEVTVPTPGKVWVAIVWPQERMVEPCDYLNPRAFITAAPGNNLGTLIGERIGRTANQNTYEYELGDVMDGTYTIATGHSFRSGATWIDHVSLTVYAPTAAVIEESYNPTALALSVIGPLLHGEPCGVIQISWKGMFTIDPSTLSDSGVPIYWNSRKTEFLYYYPNTAEWWVSPAGKLQDVQGGTYWSNKKLKKESLTCAGKFGTSDARQLALEKYGPLSHGKVCETATLAGDGLFVTDMKKLVNGVPTYWSIDEAEFAYYHHSRRSSTGLWYLTEADRFDEIVRVFDSGYGDLHHHRKFPKSAFSCGCSDDPSGVKGLEQLIPCSQATNYKYMFSNVKCQDAEYSGLVQRFCSNTCNVCAQKKPKKISLPKERKAVTKVKATTTTTTTMVVKSPASPRPHYVPIANTSGGCSRIRGGKDREGLTFGQGSCTCSDPDAVLSSRCPVAWLVAPGRSHFSRKTVNSLSDEALKSCTCTTEQDYIEHLELDAVEVEPFTCSRIHGGDVSNWQAPLGGLFDMNTLGAGSCMCFQPDSVLSNDCPSMASEKFGPGRLYWSPKPLTRLSPQQLDACKCVKRRRPCNAVQGATDVEGFTWGQGSCKCVDEAAELNNDCQLPSGQTNHLFKPGLTSFSKSTLQALSNAQLAKCKCQVWNGTIEFGMEGRRKVYIDA